ncbi:Uncharacterised protein [Klebsiella pneumoniae]|uniref:Uncharacterized protein n=1 Tax=Klebsiella pneumoniae TaxID=573 RepID=A0A2X3GFY9_KLEPN|nr:Uncharacterised protein [Klebsiella pneumoniae]
MRSILVEVKPISRAWLSKSKMNASFLLTVNQTLNLFIEVLYAHTQAG